MRILLAYDGFEHSRHALEETAKLAADGHGAVTVLSVVPPDAQGSKSGGHVRVAPSCARGRRPSACIPP